MPELFLSDLLIALGMVLIFFVMFAATQRFGDRLNPQSDQTPDDVTRQFKSGIITQQELDARQRSAPFMNIFPH